MEIKGIYIEGTQKTMESFLKDFKAELGVGINVIDVNPEICGGWKK